MAEFVNGAAVGFTLMLAVGFTSFAAGFGWSFGQRLVRSLDAREVPRG